MSRSPLSRNSVRAALILAGLFVLLLIAVLVRGSDSGDSSTPTADTVATTADAPEAQEPGAAVPEADPAPSSGTTCASGQLATQAAYAVADITGGLNVRRNPTTESESDGVLNTGDSVSVIRGAAGCSVASDGTIWWDLAADQSVDGWVASRFLTPG